MQELLTVELPDGSGWEMPRYLAKKFYDFLKQKGNDLKPGIADFESEWLKNLTSEDRRKIVKHDQLNKFQSLNV
jgi:hypothetical protein